MSQRYADACRRPESLDPSVLEWRIASVTYHRLRGVLLIEGFESGPGGGEAFTGLPLGLGQLLPSLLDVFGLVIRHGPTLRPELAGGPGFRSDGTEGD